MMILILKNGESDMTVAVNLLDRSFYRDHTTSLDKPTLIHRTEFEAFFRLYKVIQKAHNSSVIKSDYQLFITVVVDIIDIVSIYFIGNLESAAKRFLIARICSIMNLNNFDRVEFTSPYSEFMDSYKYLKDRARFYLERRDAPDVLPILEEVREQLFKIYPKGEHFENHS